MQDVSQKDKSMDSSYIFVGNWVPFPSEARLKEELGLKIKWVCFIEVNLEMPIRCTS